MFSVLCVSGIILSGCIKNPGIAEDEIVLTPVTTPSSSPLVSPVPQQIASPVPQQSTTPSKKGEKYMVTASITTSKGVIELELYADKAPGTVANFQKKADSKYYENLTFHRVEDWVIQGGDPLGNGTGGAKMPTELNDVPFVAGSLGVARGGDIKVSNDSQFFICTTDCGWLTGQYTNFGKVTKGMDVVKNIAIGDKILSVSYTTK
jgi:cyclophilin family peptidyl-prolyl cis-trans isomerase